MSDRGLSPLSYGPQTDFVRTLFGCAPNKVRIRSEQGANERGRRVEHKSETCAIRWREGNKNWLVGGDTNQGDKGDTNQGKSPWSVSPPTTKL